MAFPDDFCDESDDAYKAHESAESYVDSPGEDPDNTYHDFQARYADWIAAGSSVADMGFFFGSTFDSNRALFAGDQSQGNSAGRVIQSDCSAFANFVNQGESSLIELARQSPEVEEAFWAERTTDAYTFEDAVLEFLLSEELSAYARSYLNGACFLRNEMEDTPLAGGESATIREFYAIPGYNMLRDYRRDLGVRLWSLTHDSLTKASSVAQTPMVNLDLAMQLRLGAKGGNIYPPQSVGTGFVIFGAG